MELRDYQQRAIDDIRKAFARGHRRVCFQSVTGSGKTIVSAFMIKNAIEKGKKVLFLVHLRELLDQTEEKLKAVGITEGYRLDTIQTFSRRLDYQPDFIIVDEFQHAVSKTYLKVMERFNNIPLVGLTATPMRLDGKGLHPVADVIVRGPRMKELIEQGYLADYDIVSVDDGIDLTSIHTKMGDYDQKELDDFLSGSKIYGNAIQNYKKFLDGGKAIVFCVSIKASKQLVANMQANGIKAEHLDGTLTKEERKRIIEGFRAGQIKVISNCSLISEGFDVPDCDGIILLRPTQSLSMYLQMVGRGLRAKPNGTKALILDHVKNWSRHGLPCDDREWTLEDKKKSKKKEVEDIQVHVCKSCFVVYNSKNRNCPNCGIEKELQERKQIEEIDADMKLIDKEALKARIKNEQARCKTLADLESFARKRGFQKGWAWHVYQARMRKGKRK